MKDLVKNKLLQILSELPSEDAWIDYKAIPYKDDRKVDFIKDLCGFLNCIESYGDDKFIIIGISNNRSRIGLKNENPMQDDNEYQELAKFIFPMPIISSGIINFKSDDKELEYGYIHISKENKDRVYEIFKDYPTINNGTPIDLRYKDMVFASTSYIRYGSVNKILSGYDRRRIYDDNKKIISLKDIPNYTFNKSKQDSFKYAILIGEWDDNNNNDKDIVSSFVGEEYNNFVNNIKMLYSDDNSQISFKNNIWSINNRFEMLKNNASSFFNTDIGTIRNFLIKVLSDIDEKFNLSSDERATARILGKNAKYSKHLRKAAADTLAMINACGDCFINCKLEANNLSYYVLNDVLNSNDWKLWATLENNMPELCEANPNKFLDQIEDKLENNIEVIKHLFIENETFVATANYSAGLYAALQIAAWETSTLPKVVDILAELNQFDKKVIEKIAFILLPAFPQTKAPFKTRIAIVEKLLKTNIELGWSLLIELMPYKHSTIFPSCKPKWNNLVDDDIYNKSNPNYWNEIYEYINLAIKYSKFDVKRISDLIELLPYLPKDIFDNISNKLLSKKVINLDDNKKYILWASLEDLKSNPRVHKSNELLDKINNLSSKIKPLSITIYGQRYFIKDYWKLVEDKTNFEQAEIDIENQRINILEEIINLGLDSLFTFANNVEEARAVGESLAHLDINAYECKVLSKLNSKNNKLLELSKGYVHNKYLLYHYEWLNNVDLKKLTTLQQINFLLELPHDISTFELVDKVLKKNASEYWKKVNIRLVDDEKSYIYATKKLYSVKKYENVLSITFYALFNKKEYDYDYSFLVKCLKNHVKRVNKNTSLGSYEISTIIKKLQESKLNIKDLFSIEWSYLQVLDLDVCRPITIENEMANNPEVYNQILSLLYKPSKHYINPDNDNEAVARNAFKLLHIWNVVPGLKNGKVIKTKLYSWYKEMKKICRKSDRLEVALLNFGEVLYYSPKDKDFWIDRNVADLLDAKDSSTIRRGYSLKIYNEFGAYTCDPEGKVLLDEVTKYKKRAEEARNNQYFRLAELMEDLANSYKRDAEHMKDHYYDEF